MRKESVNELNNIVVEIQSGVKTFSDLISHTEINSMLKNIANSLAHKFGFDDSYRDDLYNDAVVLLMSECIPSFKSEEGNSFISFASFVLKHRLCRVISSKYQLIRIPEKYYFLYSKINTYISKRIMFTGKAPSYLEIRTYVETIGFDKADLKKLGIYFTKVESLDVIPENEHPLYDRIPSGKNMECDTHRIRKEISEQLNELIKGSLTTRQRELLCCYMKLERPSYKKVAALFNISPQSVEKTVKKAVLKLRENIDYYELGIDDMKFCGK